MSRECEELARIDRPARPDPISLDEIEYCDNQWGRFLKVDLVLDKIMTKYNFRMLQLLVCSSGDAPFSETGTISD